MALPLDRWHRQVCTWWRPSYQKMMGHFKTRDQRAWRVLAVTERDWQRMISPKCFVTWTQLLRLTEKNVLTKSVTPSVSCSQTLNLRREIWNQNTCKVTSCNWTLELLWYILSSSKQTKIKLKNLKTDYFWNWNVTFVCTFKQTWGSKKMYLKIHCNHLSLKSIQLFLNW